MSLSHIRRPNAQTVRLPRHDTHLRSWLEASIHANELAHQLGPVKMAEVAAVKALQVKRDCQGEDFPTYEKYAEVVQRIRAKKAT